MSAAGAGSDEEGEIRRGYGETDDEEDVQVVPKRKWAVVIAGKPFSLVRLFSLCPRSPTITNS